MKKKIIIGLLALTVVGGTVFGGTKAYAWFINKANTTVAVEKTVTHGLEIEGHINGGDDKNIMPGDEYNAEVYVVNTSSYEQKVNVTVQATNIPCKVYATWDTGEFVLKAGESKKLTGVVTVDENATIEDIPSGTHKIEFRFDAIGEQTKNKQ